MTTPSDTPMLRLTGFQTEASAQMVRHRDAVREVGIEGVSQGIDEEGGVGKRAIAWQLATLGKGIEL